MNPITDLSQLIASMTPQLRPGSYVFLTVDASDVGSLDPVMTFAEDEGTTVIITSEQAAEHGWTSDFVAAWITLTVHSALDAVGLTAAFSTALTEAGISCNVVAGAFHDHLFVPVDDADRAMAALHALSSAAGQAAE